MSTVGKNLSGFLIFYIDFATLLRVIEILSEIHLQIPEIPTL